MGKVQFVNGWWHAHDIAAAAEVLDDSLHALGLQRVPTERLEAASKAIANEAAARRHQIGIAARHANAQLAQLGRAARVRAFRESTDWGSETDEPVWLIVEPGQHARMLAEIGAPEDLEGAYDDPTVHPDPLAAAKP